MRQAQNAGTGHVTEGKLITFFCLNHFQDVRAEILQIFGNGFLENFRDQKLFLKLSDLKRSEIIRFEYLLTQSGQQVELMIEYSDFFFFFFHCVIWARVISQIHKILEVEYICNVHYISQF